MKKIAVFLMLFATLLSAQVMVTEVQVLDFGRNTIKPVFSDDGQYLLFSSFEGGNYHKLSDNKTTTFASAAYDYSMDVDGKIRYRTDSFVDDLHMNSVMMYDSKINETTVIIDKKRLDIVPKITEHGVYYLEDSKIKTNNVLAKPSAKPVVMSYNRSLLIHSYGTSKILKPLGEDKFYIWPSVSPDNSKVVFVDINDLYVIDMNGNVIFNIKEARAPKWSPDGKWIAFMRDSDDGHAFISSDIYVVRVEDQKVFKLTDTEDRIEMNPSWSPDGTQIVCEDVANDKLLILTLSIR
ncbi:MAG: hypothetical protein K9N05_00780 [Candidatus Marinimicrobia bacterium]|nr:hypothetical protein [Candidatus Neomarinimicrobiota bacterium]